ncbi:MAG: TonB family protein [Bacteroidales bacterium]|nr:TonB family protein [Bacteroidales bacterium]MBN2819509.1 TonB family protein [Bacteroidales bacterium]
MNLKKSILSFFIGLSFIAILPAQGFSDTLYFSNDGMICKNLMGSDYYRVISNDTTGKFLLLVSEYSSNHNLRMTGSFKSLNPDRKHGLFTWYFNNGDIKKQCYYNNNSLEGKYKVWYNNGQLQQLSQYKSNALEGTTKTWNESGILIKKVDYKSGLKDGKFITYYDNGQPIRKETYKEDVFLSGECFTENGSDTSYFNYFTPPSFLGGDISNFVSWVIEKLQYPKEALTKLEEGQVQVKFTVDKTGNVKGALITKHDKHYFNTEVLRVIANSPLWTPAVRDTDTIDVSVEIPIKFEIP